MIPDTSSPLAPTCSESKFSSSDGSVDDEGTSDGRAEVTPLPIQVIERNRLSAAEIAALPRFKGHSVGDPSQVGVCMTIQVI